MTDREPRDVIADAIHSTAPDLASSIEADGAMCTGWVLVTEWTDTEGQWWMSTLADRQTPSWRKRGMLAEMLADLDKPSD